MAFYNNVMIVRQELLAKLVEMWSEERLVSDIDRLPIKLSPKGKKVMGRCCVHKERAIWRYKSLPLMGFEMSDEKDELTPLSWFAKTALERNDPHSKDHLMCVVDEACSSCVKTNYEITNLCRGCVARMCYMNCPKDAIQFNSEGKAEINHDICISCGKCYQSCPYHAIVYIPVPCEEVCPVKAISKDENGVEHIDKSKCIYCGKCINACPFGAIFEVSQIFDVLQGLKNGTEMVAIVAPAILSQFKGVPTDKVYGAIKYLGFKDVIEVAQGAMETTSREAEELMERIKEGKSFMTTSCCPSWIELVRKHIPQMAEHVSTTGSPMFYTALIAKKKHPNAKVVFIGPCLAKKKEVRDNPNTDIALTFEEIGSVFAGLHIDFEKVESFVPEVQSYKEAHGFAQSGGVIGAVKYVLKDEQLKATAVANLDKKNVALLRAYAATGKAPTPFVEVMACQGGCATGPCIYNDPSTALKNLREALAKMK